MKDSPDEHIGDFLLPAIIEKKDGTLIDAMVHASVDRSTVNQSIGNSSVGFSKQYAANFVKVFKQGDPRLN